MEFSIISRERLETLLPHSLRSSERCVESSIYDIQHCIECAATVVFHPQPYCGVRHSTAQGPLLWQDQARHVEEILLDGNAWLFRWPNFLQCLNCKRGPLTGRFCVRHSRHLGRDQARHVEETLLDGNASLFLWPHFLQCLNCDRRPLTGRSCVRHSYHLGIFHMSRLYVLSVHRLPSRSLWPSRCCGRGP